MKRVAIVTAVAVLGAGVWACGGSPPVPQGGWIEREGEGFALVRHTEEGWQYWDESGRHAAVVREGALEASVDGRRLEVTHDQETGTLSVRAAERLEIYDPVTRCTGLEPGHYTNREDSTYLCRFDEGCSFDCAYQVSPEDDHWWGVYRTPGDSLWTLAADAHAEGLGTRTFALEEGDIVFSSRAGESLWVPVAGEEVTEIRRSAGSDESNSASETDEPGSRRAYDASARSDLRRLMRQMESYRQSNSAYPVSIEDLAFEGTENVTASVVGAGPNGFVLRSTHTGSPNVFCVVTDSSRTLDAASGSPSYGRPYQAEGTSCP